MEKELISIIIPTYNNRGLLEEAVQSALNQEYSPIEIIVVDDNNPDSEARKATELIMSAFAPCKNIKYIQHDRNRNGAAARNTGIQCAKGNYVAFLDDDDCFLPGKLEKQYNFLQLNPNYDAVYCLAKIDGTDEPTVPYEGNAIVPLLMNRTKMFTPSLMFRKESLLDIHGFDESFRRHQDYELLVKFFEHNHLIGCLQERLVNIHSIGGNRVSGEQIELLKERFLKTFEKTLDNIEQENPGIKRKIIVNNYAAVFISHLASHYYKRAIRIFWQYFVMSPTSFCSYLHFYTKRFLRIKMAKCTESQY